MTHLLILCDVLIPSSTHLYLLSSPHTHLDGKSFFDEKNSQMRGVAPVLIHNNWIVGMKNKLKRLEAWDLLAVDSRTNQCLPPVITQFQPPTS